MLPLMRAAQRAGHEIVVASGIEGVAEARRRGLPTWVVGPSRAEADETFRRAVPDLMALPEPQRIPTVTAQLFGTAVFQRAAELVPLAEEWRPDMVVHPISELAGAIVAARTGARHVVHGLGPLPAEAWDWFGSRFEELADQWEVPDLPERILTLPYLDNCPPALQADAVSAFGNRLSLRPCTGEVLPGEQLPWPRSSIEALPYEHTIHLTLGTLFHGATHVFETALEGLSQLPVNTLVTLGPGADPGRLGSQPPHVLVADWAPHALLLPLCDALITQGGAGTIVAALCEGLPHLILPQGADQFRNAAAAHQAGVALVLPPPQLSPATVTEAVERLLGDAPLRARVTQAQQSIAAMPDEDEVLTGLLA
ncbi:glycosyltransferase [Micromonospora sp. NPDC000089]|uniref:glycosyltransferase n=1 Tax=unclassified Micromonospora TaxID=2617518 RepID=UPI0036923597